MTELETLALMDHHPFEMEDRVNTISLKSHLFWERYTVVKFLLHEGLWINPESL